MNEHEKYVTSKWRHLRQWVRDLDSYGTNQFNVAIFFTEETARWKEDPFHRWQEDDNYSGRERVWAQAYEFTRKREREIEEFEAELMWLEAESSMSDEFPYPEALRIIAREQAALADLKRGMRD